MAAKVGTMVWIGRGLSGLISAALLLSGAMKLKGGPQVTEGFAHLGLPESIRVPLGILEIACVVVYLIPPTAVLGGILMAGYLGGAILTHWRIGEPVYAHIGLGLALWLGLYLRDARLRALIPLRSCPREA